MAGTGAALAEDVSPGDRLRAAAQELLDAMQARWPGCSLKEMDLLEASPPAFMIYVHPST
ncbi:MAG TPA: hypothetical protein VMO81_08585 [Aestuariivirgaceae bacterium]|nr:hypothetical protein [Aestuariivirgaceae bacterium]